MLVRPTIHRNQWHLCLGVYSSTFIQNTSRHTIRSSWCLQKFFNCLSTQALAKSISCDQSILLRYSRVSHSWCVYTVHSTLTGWAASHQVRAFHSLIYYSWMSLEWTTVNHSKPHGLKKTQSSPVVWGSHWGRRRLSMSPARRRRMYDEVTPSSGKNQWHAGWVGNFVYCRLKMWKFSNWSNE